MGVSQESEVADAHKSGGNDVQEQTANELDAIQRPGLLLVPVRVVLPVKMDLAILDADQAVIGDGHPVGVACQVLENDLRTATAWGLSINNPVLLPQGRDQLPKEGEIFQMPLLAMKRN